MTCCDLEHFLVCHLHAFAALGIPEQVLYDNLKTVVIERDPAGTPLLQTQFADFALVHGFTPKLCQPYRARTKGKVERGIGYVRQNFWVRVGAGVGSGELDLAALNERAAVWVATVANPRVHGTHGQGVAERLAVEQPALGALQTRPRYEVAYRSSRRVGRDGRLAYRGSLYQVPLTAALTTIEVVETLAGQLTVRTAQGEVLRLDRVEAGQSVLQPAPLPVRSPLAASEAPQDPHPETQNRAGRETVLPPDHLAPVVELRPLSVYQEVLDAAAGA